MRIFALEISERIGTLATLHTSGQQVEVVREATLPEDQRSARSLLPAVQALFRDSGWKPNEIDLICVTTGPGSFTSLRIGVTTAKTLAYAVGAELVEVHTLSAIAARVTTPFPRLWTILDAQRQELFVAQFSPDWLEKDNNLPKTRIVGIDAWLQELQPGDTVSGPPLRKLADRLPEGVLAAHADLWNPNAVQVGRLGIAAHRHGHTVDAIQLVPRYYRKSAAEEVAEGSRQATPRSGPPPTAKN